SKFLNALRIGGLDYEGRVLVQPLEAEDDLKAIRKALQVSYDQFHTCDWIANITGGTKPMSIGAYEFFKEFGGKIVYTNVSRPSQILDLENGTTETCHHRLTIKEFLAGYGFESLKAYDKIAAAESRAKGWIESATLLARYCSNTEVLLIDDNERNKARDKGIELAKERFAFSCERLRQIWLTDLPCRKLNKYEAQFLTGGWLEVFFWNLLQHHAEALGIWDVRLGLEVGRSGDKSGNDVDVLFMHDYGLSMMECKSGSQDHDPSTHILYQVEAVTRQFRALRVRSYLATTSNNVLDNDKNVKPFISTRSDIYNCKIITSNEVIRLASEAVMPDQVKSIIFGQKEK
ncbi:MAG: Card1-like endonuclease domain-containing protein, partial [Gemmataceae bacterium]